MKIIKYACKLPYISDTLYYDIPELIIDFYNNDYLYSIEYKSNKQIINNQLAFKRINNAKIRKFNEITINIERSVFNNIGECILSYYQNKIKVLESLYYFDKFHFIQEYHKKSIIDKTIKQFKYKENLLNELEITKIKYNELLNEYPEVLI